jgi:hypothetical protein
VLSLSSLIEFLLDMLRDEATQAEFARDPSATLAARGLAGVTAQDIRDVQPMLADVDGVQCVAGDGPAEHGGRLHGGSGHHGSGGHHDVVREIHHVTREYTVTRPEVTNVTQEYTYNSYTEFSTDNSVHASDGSTVIQDSYNQDNDGVDNKGGRIDDSTVSGGDMGGSGNTTDTSTVTGSGNDSTTVVDSGKETVVQDWDDVGNSGDPGGADDGGTPASIGYGEPDSGSFGSSFGSGTVNDSYAVDAPASSVTSGDGAEHAGLEHV